MRDARRTQWAGTCQRASLSPMCLLVRPRALQFFFFTKAVSLLFVAPLHATLSVGQIYALKFVDVDGHTLSTADGHVSVVVLATTVDSEKARAVGDRVPEYCLGNPSYRMITVLNFTKKHILLGRKIATLLVRRRLNEEAKRLQPRYDAKKITHNARGDVFAVADFDGTVSSQLGGQPGATDFHVFVFGRDGELLKQWDNVPAADDLAAVLK
jgi:hypothetical protein